MISTYQSVPRGTSLSSIKVPLLRQLMITSSLKVTRKTRLQRKKSRIRKGPQG